jgi:hypothetical protein
MAAERNDRSRPYYAVTSSQPSGITTVHESAVGTKRTNWAGLLMSGYRGRPEVIGGGSKRRD